MIFFESVFKFVRMVSLDVALGGAILSLVISDFLEVEMPLSIPICLGISIWLIYTLDHLMDAFKRQNEPTIARHLFHRKHYKILTLAVVGLTIIGISSVFLLPSITFIYGVGLLLCVLFYFSLIYFFKGFYLKEVFVAIVYSSGIFLGPISLLHGEHWQSIGLFFVQTFFLALINLLLFSYIEHNQDTKDQHSSLAVKLGLINTKRTLYWLFIVLILIQGYSLLLNKSDSSNSQFQLLFMAMTIVLFIIHHWPDYFRENERYRIVGDGIFFIPALWLL